MKARDLLAVALLALTSCLPIAHTVPSSPPPVPVDMRPPPVQTCKLTLHADADFGEAGRGVLTDAARDWRELSKGNIDLEMVFDLTEDFVDKHELSTVSFVMPIFSDSELGQAIDKRMGATESSFPVAVTTTMLTGAKHVFLIVDRIDPAEAPSIVTHELGHVCSLPDLPVLGAIMSAASLRGAEPVEGFQGPDYAICAAYHYCD